MSDLVRSRSFAARLVGAALALAVAGIHIADQGGFPGDKEAQYILVLFYVLEAVAVVTAALLLLPLSSKLTTAAWTVAATVVAAGPFLGYVLSRGPGLPDFDEDRGSWIEPLGVASLIVEATLLALSVTAVVLIRRAGTRSSGQPLGIPARPARSAGAASVR
jgi:hypothetical protein